MGPNPADYRLAVLGPSGVGKTALTIQLCQQRFVDTHDHTIADSYRTDVVITGRTFSLEVFDIGGQKPEVSSATELNNYSDWISRSQGIILVYNITERDSFTNIEFLVKHVISVKSWYPVVDTASLRPERLPIMIVGNKNDLPTIRQVSPEEGRNLAKEQGCMFIETSAKQNMNVKKAFRNVGEVLSKPPNSGSSAWRAITASELPESWPDWRPILLEQTLPPFTILLLQCVVGLMSLPSRILEISLQKLGKLISSEPIPVLGRQLQRITEQVAQTDSGKGPKILVPILNDLIHAEIEDHWTSTRNCFPMITTFADTLGCSSDTSRLAGLRFSILAPEVEIAYNVPKSEIAMIKGEIRIKIADKATRSVRECTCLDRRFANVLAHLHEVLSGATALLDPGESLNPPSNYETFNEAKYIAARRREARPVLGPHDGHHASIHGPARSHQQIFRMSIPAS
ncbi:hypothetical protein NUW58_g4686 [Xylaria curta]|uniref:Uncharacterized protein n=1 Tax=Xylaria curta TaxID=42375 RepID=A0ACC1P6X7_9PEZI|nr:hypothetical protein NUW58_g4686 [Xylaria curta]